jgi:arylsulfatase A-like enzyme
LYVAYFAPHSPMEDPPHYMERMAHVVEYERRMGLASVLAMDDGIGLIRNKLSEMGIADNTLIFYISDNGAPLREGAYIGSLNTPMTGEKGMQTDGGQRVPFLAAWPGKIPAGQVFEEAVWSLDATATSLAVAGAPLDDKIEGVNLMPWMLGEKSGQVHDALYWRWRSQAAVLSGNWKFVRLGNKQRYLFDMTEIGKETAADNKIEQYPEIAAELERKLKARADTWHIKGLPDTVVAADQLFFDLHVDLTIPPPPFGEGRTGVYIPWREGRPAHAGLDRWK